MLLVLDRTDRHLYGFLYLVLGTSTHCPVRRLILIIFCAFRDVLDTFTRKSLQNYYFFLTWPNFFARKIKNTRYLVDFVRLCSILPFKNTHINESLTFTTTTTRLVPANTRPYLDHIRYVAVLSEVCRRTLRLQFEHFFFTLILYYIFIYNILFIPCLAQKKILASSFHASEIPL